MLYAFGFIGLFTMGGVTGLMLATLGVDVHVHDTYFVIAHFHYIMVGGMVMAYLGGIHYWWPKISGRLYPGGMGKALRRPSPFSGLQFDVSSRSLFSAISECRDAIMPIRPSSRSTT